MTSSARCEWLENFPGEVAALDTRRHALIEASAGTGKTYAIEHLVLRLLVENPEWKPEEILLLSFTEKTAAELRERVRNKLKEQLGGEKKLWAWTEVQAARIREAWLQGDDLAVHTIHGFCHAALLRDPVANGALIRPEVMDDRLLADKALENLLRGAWARSPRRLGLLREALGINSGDKWRDRLIQLALAYHPWRGDRIEPRPDPGEVERLEARAAELATEALSALAEIERGTFPESEYRKSFGVKKTGLDTLRKHAFNKVFEAAIGWARVPRGEQAGELLTFFAKSFTKASPAVKHGFAFCLTAEASALPEWNRLARACTGLRELGSGLDDAREQRRFGLQAEAAMELREELGLEKRRLGAISYDDMQKNLALAFRKDPGLAFKLRHRYKVCIVDEFQDTDSLQWGMLRALCLRTEGGAKPLPLFLVGDPKQAIYGFRGGDLGTYLKARGELRDLAKRSPPEAQGAGLTKNHRSRPDLIAALNAVFPHPDWFREAAGIPESGAWHLPENSDEVVFTPVIAGRADAPAGPALWLRDFSGEEKIRKPQVEREVRRWIAARIRDLAGDLAGLQVRGKGEATARAPRFGDIAVLVRKHAEAEALEKVLRASGIPCRVRRRGGVFHGPAAEAMRLLLDLIPDVADPGTQAKILLLPFSRREENDWPRGRPAVCPPMLERWGLLARQGRWPEFFHAVLNDAAYLSRLARESESEAERLSALARALGEAGSAPGTTARGLCERFDALRRGEGGDEAGAIGGGSGEEGTVTLMTLHLSKGLEFPVVFLAATGEGRRPDFHTLRSPEGFRHVLDKKDPEARLAYEEQSAEEDKRLFYVAFTRAMDRLYVPLLPESYSRSGSGPLGGFAAQALRAAAARADGANEIRMDEDPVRDDPAPLPQADARSGDAEAGRDREAALRATRAAFARRRHLDSYSGLARRAGERAAPEELVEENGTRVLRENPGESETGEEAARGSDKNFPGISREELPAGAAAGNALHKLLEHADFASVLTADSVEAWLTDPLRRGSIEERLRDEGLEASYAAAAARAVWNTLRMPLPDPAGGADFRLADVADRRHELEFLFPFADGGFLQGFIDLVFRRGDRYYLLDWKSNLLDGYGPAAVLEDMLHHRYDLQWQIYSVALDRWLSARLPGYDPALHFGGVYYVYLRGASPGRFSGFARLPSVEDLRVHFPAVLGRALGRRAEEVPA